MKGPLDLSRRRLFSSTLATAAAFLLPSPLKASLEKLARESADEKDVRSLAFHNTHTNERIESVYCVSGRYQESGLTAIDWILRDHRTNEVTRIDPKLLDLLHLLRGQATAEGAKAGVYEIISGYRSPYSNEMLRSRSGAVARHSLHLKGMAADVRLTGVPLRRLHAAALDIARGGVGYYPGDDFVHVDTGRVRSW
ncbi:MAG TPA: DUF882 domain-containing protein [Thermoanaerobaculia bacterium]|nr:DUF882 domain-containing protein [Thermoanaerobaculia bacterium]